MSEKEKWKQAYESEATKFRAETLRTSELHALLTRFVEEIHPEHRPGPWSRSCVQCKLIGEAMELLQKPVNAAQPVAQTGVPEGWISTADRLPEDGDAVVFVVRSSGTFEYLNGKRLGGIYVAGRFGGFCVPGLQIDASLWQPMPPIAAAPTPSKEG